MVLGWQKKTIKNDPKNRPERPARIQTKGTGLLLGFKGLEENLTFIFELLRFGETIA